MLINRSLSDCWVTGLTVEEAAAWLTTPSVTTGVTGLSVTAGVTGFTVSVTESLAVSLSQ
jgi:hypothetical protein